MKSKTTIVKKVGRPKKTTSTSHYHDINEMARDAGTVLKSLCKRDGNYDTATATAVSRLFGNQISLLKEKVNIAKLNNQTTNQDVLRISK